MAKTPRVPRKQIGRAPRRHSSEGGYSRGEETYGRLIEAAIRVFGEEGYERASTRRIAEEAGVKPPALQYYFDSKDGLHLACAEHLLAYAAGALSGALNTAKESLKRPRPGTAVTALCDLLDAVVDATIAKVHSPGRSMFMSRLQADGVGPAFPVIRDRLIRPLHTLCWRLIATALGQKKITDEIKLRSSVILSQVMAFHIARINTLALLGWENFDGPRRDMVKQVLRRHTRAALSDKRPAAT